MFDGGATLGDAPRARPARSFASTQQLPVDASAACNFLLARLSRPPNAAPILGRNCGASGRDAAAT
eukprot:729227-Pyramimonas_sp.AAC.1